MKTLHWTLLGMVMLLAIPALAQESGAVGTSATDSKLRIEKGAKRVKTSGPSPSRPGKAVKKQSKPASLPSNHQARVFKRHNHFATGEIKQRTKSRNKKRVINED